jgi:hypothetical protein
MTKLTGVAGPVDRFVAGRSEAVAALGDDELLGADLLGLLVDPLAADAAEAVVAGEQAEVGLVPAFRGHGPVFASRVEDQRGLFDGARIVLDLAGIDGIGDLGALLVDRDLRLVVAEVLLELLGHPLDRVEVVLLEHAHLVADLPLVLGDHPDAFGHHADVGQQTTHQAVQRRRIDAHRAVDRAPPAVGTGSEGDVLELVEIVVRQGHLVGADPPREDATGPVVIGLEELADLVGLVARRHLGIARVGEHIVAGVVAHPAVHAADERTDDLTAQLFR